MAGFVQANRKDCGHGSRHDSTGCNPCQQQPLPPVQLGTPSAQGDRQRSGHELHDHQKNQHCRPQLHQGCQVEHRCEQDKQPRDQQNAQVLLEVKDVSHVDISHVRKPDPHQRDGQQAGFMHQCRQILQILRQPVSFHQLAERPSSCYSEHGSAQQDPAERLQALGPGSLGASCNDEAVNHHCKQSADRIDDDAFPPQDIGNRRVGAHHAQHRYDDCRARYKRQASQEQRQVPIEAKQPTSGQGDHAPGGQRANAGQAAHDGADSRQLRDA